MYMLLCYISMYILPRIEDAVVETPEGRPELLPGLPPHVPWKEFFPHGVVEEVMKH